MKKKNYIVDQYLSHVFDEIKGRPIYIVDTISNFENK